MKKTLMVVVAACFAGTAWTQNTTGSHFQAPNWMAGPLVRHPQPDAQPGPVTGKPFSGTEIRHTIQTLSDGTRTDQTESTAIYRDADGRMRMESESNVVIYDPVARVQYHLNTQRKTVDKTDVAANATSMSIAVTSHSTSWSNGSRINRDFGSKEDLGSQVFNGISARGTRMTITIPGKSLGADHDLKVVNERWFSEELGVLVKSTNSDPRFGTTTYELTNLTQATPDPSLFRVPGDYQEVSRPSAERMAQEMMEREKALHQKQE